jgi:hypothetical protein
MSNKKIQYGKVYDVGSDDEEIVDVKPMDVVDDNSNIEKTTIELSELSDTPQEQSNNRSYKLLNESVKRATSPDELIFRSDVSLGNSEYMKKMRTGKREKTYKMWKELIEQGRKIDEDVIRMMQNYIISECRSGNLENVERCRKYREILDAYWNKNPSLREKQQIIDGGKRRRAKKYTRRDPKENLGEPAPLEGIKNISVKNNINMFSYCFYIIKCRNYI